MDTKIIWLLAVSIAFLIQIILLLVKFFVIDRNGRKKIINNPNNPFPCQEHTNLLKDLKNDYKELDKKIDRINEFCAEYKTAFNSLKENNEEQHRNFTIRLNRR